MRVAFVLTHTNRGSPGSFERIRHLSIHLDKQGIECTILTPYDEDQTSMPNIEMEVIPNWINSMKLSSLSYSVFRKLSSSRLGSKIFLSENALRRASTNLAKGIGRIVEREGFDIIHAVQPVAALACLQIKQPRPKIITDLHNIWPEELVLYNIIKKNDPIFKRLANIEKDIANSSNSVTVVSSLMKDYILKNYSTNADSLVVLPPAGFVSNITKTRKRNVVFAGMVSKREHVDLFANSIPLVKSKAFFHISNNGDDLSNIKMITQKYGNSNVSYSWFRTRDELINFLHSSRIGIVTSQNDICRQIGPAIKLFEYISCGLPVVANDIGSWTNIIKEKEIGILTEDDPKKFAQAIDLLLEESELWNKMHENAINLVKTKENWELNVKNVLIPLYETLLSNK